VHPVLEEIQKIQEQAICLYNEAEVEAALDSMASDITVKLHDKNPLVLCVINGGIIATGKLLTRLHFPLNVDSLHASRYRNATSGRDLHWLFKPTTPLKDRTLLIVDDILDEGHTLKAIVDYCQEQQAAAVYTAALLNKKLDKVKPIQADFVGLQVDNHYLFGYGMDYKGYLRNAPGIYACKEVL
jgi:hypoxanthine phosphoribosyltransferase